MSDESLEVRMLLPTWNSLLGGYPCAVEWCADNPGHACGCPKCLHEKGQTLVYDHTDTREEVPLWQRRKRVVKERTALLVAETIVAGYPGCDPNLCPGETPGASVD